MEVSDLQGGDQTALLICLLLHSSKSHSCEAQWYRAVWEAACLHGRFPSNVAVVVAVHPAESGRWKPDTPVVADEQPWDGYIQVFLEEEA